MTRASGIHILIVHGAGIDADSFATLHRRLVRHGFRPTSVRRRGYDHRPATADLGTHVDDLIDLLDAPTCNRTIVVGVSGGATISLSLALRGHPNLIGAVVHEPLIGPAASSQHDIISGSIDRFLTTPGADAAEAFLERLVTTPTWNSLPTDIRQRSLSHEATMRTEVAGFGAFVVDDQTLSTTPSTNPARIVWTVGRQSPPWRHEAATVGELYGWRTQTLDCVHTPQFENPDDFAKAISVIAKANSVNAKANSAKGHNS